MLYIAWVFRMDPHQTARPRIYTRMLLAVAHAYRILSRIVRILIPDVRASSPALYTKSMYVSTVKPYHSNQEYSSRLRSRMYIKHILFSRAGWYSADEGREKRFALGRIRPGILGVHKRCLRSI